MSRRRMLFLGVGGLLLAGGLLGYRWLVTSTPQTTDQVVARFRVYEEAAAGEASVGFPRAVRTLSPTAEPGSSDPVPIPGATVLSDRLRRRPEPGVYSWDTEGYEEVTPGVRRAFPSLSHRIITRDQGPTWTMHHIYSEEHQEWVTAGPCWMDQCLIVNRRLRIILGPLTWDRETDYEPALHLLRAPQEVGARWVGSWANGAGVYSGRIFEHTEVNVGGEPVEVWGVEFRAQVTGRERGKMIIRFWWSPEHIMSVREEGETTIRQGAGSYRSEWKISLRSLRPRR